MPRQRRPDPDALERDEPLSRRLDGRSSREPAQAPELMAPAPGERAGSFMYEPAEPPTIPPWLTVADFRRRRPRRRPARRRRS